MATGVGVEELVRYGLYQVVFVLVPGIAAYLALATRPGDPIRVFSLGWALGIALVLASFALTAAIGVRELLYAHPVVVLALSVPQARRHLAAIAWDELPSLRLIAAAVAALCLALLYLAIGPFIAAPLPEHAASVEYYVDNVFDISLVGEVMHHWPPSNPSVAGAPLRYHLLAFLDMGAAANVAGVEPSTLVLRFFPVSMTVLSFLLMTSLGRRVAGAWSVGVLAASLLFITGELDVFPRVAAPFAGSFATSVWASPTYMFGLPFFLAATLIVCDSLVRRERPTPAQWVLFVVLVVVAAGAKASAAPVLLGGLVLTAVGCAVRRRGPLKLLLGFAGIVLAAYAVAYVVLYSGGTSALELKPFDFVRLTLPGLRLAELRDDVLLAGLATLPILIAACFALIGIVWARRRITVPLAFLLALLLVSLVPTLVLRGPGLSQLYFLLYGIPPALVVAAVGIRHFWLWATGVGVRPRALVVAAVAVVGVAVIAAAWAWTYDDISSMRPAYRSYLIVVAAAVAAAVIISGRTRRPAVAAPIAVALLIPVALTDQPLDIVPARLKAFKDGVPMNPVDQPGARGTTRELTDGLRWVRDHTPGDALLAVNVHTRNDRWMDSRYFYISALAERSVYLESWEYTPEGADPRGPTFPFAEQQLINDRAVLRGRRRELDLLRSRGVDYIVIDRVHAKGSPRLDDEATRVFANSAVIVYRL